MDISSHSIKTQSEYLDALMRVNSLMDAKRIHSECINSVDDELKALAKLIKFYEDEHFPIGKPK